MATNMMDMNGCDIAHETIVNEEYGDEVMCTGWNPQLALANDSPVAQVNRHVNLLSDPANVDTGIFLKKMYEYQC